MGSFLRYEKIRTEFVLKLKIRIDFTTRSKINKKKYENPFFYMMYYDFHSADLYYLVSFLRTDSIGSLIWVSSGIAFPQCPA